MFQDQPAALPPLAFATPAPSPRFVLRRRRERASNEPPLLKRKRPAFPTLASESFFPTSTNLPYLDCGSFGSNKEEDVYTSTSPLPNISLYPRTKRSRNSCFISSSPQEHYYDQDSAEPETRRRRLSSSSSIPTGTTSHSESTPELPSSTDGGKLTRTTSSKSMLNARRPSLNMTRSVSLQFNLSLMNLAAAATNSNNGSSHSRSSCPISASTSAMMPKRKSLLHIPCTSSSSQDMAKLLDEGSNHNKEGNARRSPVAATLDYLATAIRLPDVTIGLSI